MSRRHRNPDWPRIRAIVRRRDRDRPCLFCGIAPVILPVVHHVVALEAGGTDDLDNLRLTCGPCHKAHHRKPVSPEFAEWDAYLARLMRSP